jgi:hypothetical protein
MKSNHFKNDRPSKRQYRSPILIQYGNLKNLTKGGTGNKLEGGPGVPSSKYP